MKSIYNTNNDILRTLFKYWFGFSVFISIWSFINRADYEYSLGVVLINVLSLVGFYFLISNYPSECKKV